MGVRRCTLRTFALAGLLLLVGPLVAAARADQREQATFPSRFTSSSITMDQGERFTFQNLDVTAHDVTAETRGPDGKPLFGTPLIGTGEEAFVEGSQYLTTGHYPFVCSIHANMVGTLHVTSNGTPVPRPGSGGGGGSAVADKTKPRVSLRVLSTRVSRVRRVREIVAEVKVDEAAKVALTAKARVRGRVKQIATGAVELTGAGTRRPELKLNRTGKKLLKKRRPVRVSITALAIDSSGNRSTAGTKRKLKR